MLSELRRRKFTYLFGCFDLDRNGTLEKGDYEQFSANLVAAFDLGGNPTRAASIHAQTMALWDFVRSVADRDGDDRWGRAHGLIAAPHLPSGCGGRHLLWESAPDLGFW